MIAGKGIIEQIYLDERRAARITCAPGLIPGPGQYLLASNRSEPYMTLAQPIYASGAWAGGFYAAGPLPAGVNWLPGAILDIRGPLGHGFNLPPATRKVALAALEGSGARVLALLEPALSQNASVVLLCDQPPAGLPAALEILPTAALAEIGGWADYLACQVHRERLLELLKLLNPERTGQSKSLAPRANHVQVLVETAVPCGGLAECGACAVNLKAGREFKLACKDGPVFDLI